jgi:hypothetical protein
VAGDNDVLIAPNSRSNGASKVLTKHLEKATHSETLCLVYKEYPGKGRQKLMETVHAASLKPFGLQPAEARLHYQLTTTTSDAIVQVQDLEPLLVEVQEKEAILGREQLLAQEKMLKPTDKTVLFLLGEAYRSVRGDVPSLPPHQHHSGIVWAVADVTSLPQDEHQALGITPH